MPIPSALKSGDTIGIFAPSSRVDTEQVEKAKNILESKGLSVYIHPQTALQEHQSAGNAKQKADAFHDLLTNHEIKAIWAASGGNRCSQMLDYVDWHIVKQNPKILIGFSDFTNLLNAIYKKTGLSGFYAPTLLRLNTQDIAYTDFLLEIMKGKEFFYPMKDAQIINKGVAEGRLIGGTLMVYQTLLGTEYQADTAGNILFLEEVYEETNRIDRVLLQLKRTLPFSKLSGIMFGSFTKMLDTGVLPFGFTIEDMIKEHTEGLDIPIIMNAPFGHGDHFQAIPFGTKVKLDVSEKAKLTLLEPVVKA